jgi:chemotaxis protein CheY-P-specific phosphatase CheC
LPDFEERVVEEVNRMRELASVGTAHAATAFAQLVGRTIVMRVPKVRGLDACPEEHATPGEVRAGRLDPAWSTGVLFEFEGCLGALVGVFFRRSVRDVVVRRVLGEPDGCLPPGSAEAVLMELGNILVSTVASAIADTLGERLLPSIPVLAMEGAGSELAALTDNRLGDHPIRIECEFTDFEGEVGGLLVLVPDVEEK